MLASINSLRTPTNTNQTKKTDTQNPLQSKGEYPSASFVFGKRGKKVAAYIPKNTVVTRYTSHCHLYCRLVKNKKVRECLQQTEQSWRRPLIPCLKIKKKEM